MDDLHYLKYTQTKERSFVQKHIYTHTSISVFIALFSFFFFRFSPTVCLSISLSLSFTYTHRHDLHLCIKIYLKRYSLNSILAILFLSQISFLYISFARLDHTFGNCLTPIIFLFE